MYRPEIRTDRLVNGLMGIGQENAPFFEGVDVYLHTFEEFRNFINSTHDRPIRGKRSFSCVDLHGDAWVYFRIFEGIYCVLKINIRCYGIFYFAFFGNPEQSIIKIAVLSCQTEEVGLGIFSYAFQIRFKQCPDRRLK